MTIKQQQQSYKRYFDHNRPDISYTIADQVLKRIPSIRPKTAAFYCGPMIILKAVHPTYLIQDTTDQKIYQAHVSQLRPTKFN